MVGMAPCDTLAFSRKLLLQYCKLETAAMAIIWRDWIEGGAQRPCDHEHFGPLFQVRANPPIPCQGLGGFLRDRFNVKFK